MRGRFISGTALHYRGGFCKFSRFDVTYRSLAKTLRIAAFCHGLESRVSSEDEPLRRFVKLLCLVVYTAKLEKNGLACYCWRSL